MWSDILSVRSQPISSQQKRHQTAPPPFDFDSPSDHSRVHSPFRYQNWRTSLHPEVDQKYKQLIKGETVRWPNSPEKAHQKAQTLISTTNEQKRQNEKGKDEYENRIRGLQEQNNNLKEELYYLRQALLINFQTKQTKQVPTTK